MAKLLKIINLNKINSKQNKSRSRKNKQSKRTSSKLYGGAGPYKAQKNDVENDYELVDNDETNKPEMSNNSKGSKTYVEHIAMKSPSTRKLSNHTKKNSTKHTKRTKHTQKTHLFISKVSPHNSNPQTLNHNNENWATNSEINQRRLLTFKTFIEELNAKAKGLTICDGKVILYYIGTYFKSYLTPEQQKDIQKHMLIEQTRIGIETTFFNIVDFYIDLLKLGVEPKQNTSEKNCDFVELKKYLQSNTYKPIYQKLFMHPDKEYVGNDIDKLYNGIVENILVILKIA